MGKFSIRMLGKTLSILALSVLVASVPVSDDRQLFSFLTGGGLGSKEASGEVGEVLGSLGLTAAQLSILGGLLAARLGLQAAPVVAGAASNAYSGLTTVTLSRSDLPAAEGDSEIDLKKKHFHGGNYGSYSYPYNSFYQKPTSYYNYPYQYQYQQYTYQQYYNPYTSPYYGTNNNLFSSILGAFGNLAGTTGTIGTIGTPGTGGTAIRNDDETITVA